MRILERESCVRFREATDDDQHYVNITGFDGGCYSEVGLTLSGAQVLNLEVYPLNTGCFRLGTIIHEFLHTLGFYHMHSTSNRDEYVRIAFENIASFAKNNFDRHDEEKVDNFDQEYDFGSVLHYQPTAFSTNGKPTIIALDPENPDVAKMGQRAGMSRRDIDRLNTMYRCPIGH